MCKGRRLRSEAVLLRLFLGLFCIVGFTEVARAKEPVFSVGRHGLGKLQTIEGLPVVFLAGTGREIGAQHAALLAKPAAALLKYPGELLSEEGAYESWPLAIATSSRLLAQAPQRYLDELAAVAEHAALDRNKLALANTLLELRRLGCSTLIVEPGRSATGGPLFGRNFDFPSLGLLENYNLLMIVQPAGYHSFAAVGYPGLLGVLSGINDAGLAVATLDVYEAGNRSPPLDLSGVPLLLVFRQILEECTTVAEAEALIRRTKATTWANLAVCDRIGGAVFEITSTEVTRRDPNSAILPCTNHFRTEGLAVDTRCARYESLQKAATGSSHDVAAVHRHLHEANQGELTLQTMVFEPRELVLHLAVGRPPSSALPLKRIELRDLLEFEAESRD
ncbi:MAG: C45 family peptidase [Pirellulales bacterium]|nr:C45 family peptidase [Pirellulales bacterium]